MRLVWHLAQDIDAERIAKIGARGAQMRFEFSADGSEQFRREPVVGMRNADDAFFELSEAVEVAGGGKKALADQHEAAVVDGPAHSGKGGFAHHLLVVEQAQDFVEFSGIDRLGNSRQAARLEDSPNLAQREVHPVRRHMMQ